MFDEDYKESLEKLNSHYSQYIGYKILEEDAEFTPEILEYLEENQKNFKGNYRLFKAHL